MSFKSTFAASVLALSVPATSLAQNNLPAPVDGVILGSVFEGTPDLHIPFADVPTCIGFGKFYAVDNVRCDDRTTQKSYPIFVGQETGAYKSIQPPVSPPFADKVSITGIRINGTKLSAETFDDAASCLTAGNKAAKGTALSCLNPYTATLDTFADGGRKTVSFRNLIPRTLPPLQQ
jgi:hypothetical protein